MALSRLQVFNNQRPSGHLIGVSRMLYLAEKVKQAAAQSEITGVLAMAECAGLSYERTVRVWKGNESARLADVRQVLNSIGYDLKVVKCSLAELKA